MDIKTLFDHAAQDYDRARKQYIPCFDEFYQTALALLPFDRQDEVNILDLGAGTGLLAALVAEAFPQAWLALFHHFSTVSPSQFHHLYHSYIHTYCTATERR